jgi:hypothetical protein
VIGQQAKRRATGIDGRRRRDNACGIAAAAVHAVCFDI